jgi:hypothetical protein
MSDDAEPILRVLEALANESQRELNTEPPPREDIAETIAQSVFISSIRDEVVFSLWCDECFDDRRDEI